MCLDRKAQIFKHQLPSNNEKLMVLFFLLSKIYIIFLFSTFKTQFEACLSVRYQLFHIPSEIQTVFLTDFITLGSLETEAKTGVLIQVFYQGRAFRRRVRETR